MRASQAVVHITKIAAAKRQLEAAIRMFFAREDELAVHTVASAAFRVLRDIYVKKGKTFGSDMLRNGIFYIAKRHAEGKTPADEIPLLKSLPRIEELAQQIKEQGDNFDRDQIRVVVSRHQDQKHWPSTIANFLKHADRDSDSHIALDEVENEKILMGACAAYVGLMRMSSPEIDTFYAYWFLKKGWTADIALIDVQAIMRILKEKPEEQWHLACVAIIERLKELAKAEGCT